MNRWTCFFFGVLSEVVGAISLIFWGRGTKLCEHVERLGGTSLLETRRPANKWQKRRRCDINAQSSESNGTNSAKNGRKPV